jgi:DNA-binding NarL/FixJ family response regulator
VRVVIAEDMALLREGLKRLLTEQGVDVVAQVDDVRGLMAAVAHERPDVALVDIKLPPTWTDEGLQAALSIRTGYPRTAVLLLSSYLDARFASSLLEAHTRACGYLLKDHVADPAALVDALSRVSQGECVVDPSVVAQLRGRRREPGPLDRLTTRQSEILDLMAQGYSNTRICHHLTLSPRTVESHVRSIFSALSLPESGDGNRRVLAVLTYLRT